MLLELHLNTCFKWVHEGKLGHHVRAVGKWKDVIIRYFRSDCLAIIQRYK